MLTIPFDVNDAELREAFLHHLMMDALAPLDDGRRPRWGKMTAQQMVEHLAWSFELSTGRAEVECQVPEEKRERMRAFLRNNRLAPPDFMNPALAGGLPPLRTAGLAHAKAALGDEVARFVELSRLDPAARHTHPVFGPIGVEEWARSHFKHGYHHLLQFGLLAETP